ncbi:MAG: hypothetical protein BWY21_00644 [Parcubacteria group bacterium ADurb.Bin216]|nr:MAG: hypothetical protein BWY21_00644 [Parcubacteria group bacterium ADurb.Bin216]
MYKSDYESFISNPIWKEMKGTLEEIRVGLFEDLKDLDPHLDGSSLARQQGRLKMLEFVLLLPEDILREINEKLEENTEDKNE